MSRQGNLRIYSWYSLPDLKHDQKCFIRIPSLNVPEIRPLGTFSQFHQMVAMGTMTATIKWQEKKLSINIVSDHLK